MLRWIRRVVERRLRRYMPREHAAILIDDLEDERERWRRERGHLAAEWHVLGDAVSLLWAYHHRHTPPWQGVIDRLVVDVVQAWRGLRARPSAPVTVVLVLAIGVGLSTAIFVLADPFLLKPLPYRSPDELVVVRVALRPLDRDRVRAGRDGGHAFEAPSTGDWRARTDLFSSITFHGQPRYVRVASPHGARVFWVVPVSKDFFDVLGTPARPVRWRAARQDDTWSIPPGVLFPWPWVTWRPTALVPTDFGDTVTSTAGKTEPLVAIARVQPGVTPDHVRAALSASFVDAPFRLDIEPMTAYMQGATRPVAAGALLAALLVALACTATVANLFIARHAHRVRDLATRLAVGATRRDLLRLAIVDLVILGMTSAGLALVVAHLTIGVMTWAIPAEYVSLGAPAVTLRAVVFVSVIVALVIGLAAALPVWMTWRAARSAAAARVLVLPDRRTGALRAGMTAGQTAAGTLLLAGGVLFSMSYLEISLKATGFSRGLGAFSVSYPVEQDRARLISDVTTTADGLRRLPGVSDAAAIVGPLMENQKVFGGIDVAVAGRRLPLVPHQVTSNYFEVAGARFLAGRSLRHEAGQGQPAVVTEAFARWMDPSQPVDTLIGAPIAIAGYQAEIVGVVQDMQQDRGMLDEPAPRIYVRLGSPVFSVPNWPVNYLVQAPGWPDAVREASIATIVRVNSEGAVTEAGLLDDRFGATVKDRTFATLVLVLFAAATLIVAAAGVFGTVAFLVSRRRREIAIRMAVGAAATQILRAVIGETVAAAAAGIVVGVVAARWLSAAVESLLYRVDAGSPLWLAAAATLMAALVAIAALLPARRALGVSPREVLRFE